ncbi:MAG: hypothetical protein ACUVUG_05970 [Candidatus Aminicenantia bacterium]
MDRDESIKLENKKIRYLRLIVDLSIAEIYQSEISLMEALRVVKRVKEVALALFPDSGETFDLIYAPRFQRAILERFRLN